MGGFKTLQQIREIAEPGDILEFDRGFYSHYALYLGNDRVINIDSEDKESTSALICEEPLATVCRGSKVRVNNHSDVAQNKLGVRARPVWKIIQAAREHEGCRVPYNFMGKNCEYYCMYWRYGAGFSTQVASPVTSTHGGEILAGAAAVGVGVGVAAGLLMNIFGNKNKHNN